MSITVHIIDAPWSTYKQALQTIRRIVFIEEQQVPQALEWDGLDDDSWHFLAINELGLQIGCARLLSGGQIGRMAVLQSHRGTGAGAALLDAAVAKAKTLGFERVFLHAQSYAQTFYRKGGFIAFGEEFSEAGIDHVAMEMKLPLAFAHTLNTDESPPKPFIRTQTLQADQQHPADPQAFHDMESGYKLLVQLAVHAKRKLYLMHPNLDQAVFAHTDFVEALSALARSAPLVDIKILIMDTRLVIDRGHDVLELARRLDDKIKLRVLPEPVNSETSAFVCADQSAYWLLPNWEQFDGVCDLYNTVTSRRLREVFSQAWEKSREDPQMRRLKL